MKRKLSRKQKVEIASLVVTCILFLNFLASALMLAAMGPVRCEIYFAASTAITCAWVILLGAVVVGREILRG